ncbi:MAG: acyl-CoA dehydrogenase family protein [Gemmatimonadota bacterium]|nr:acyl-CoA dehydrogenase family protein [Gemmatimonadota bacterium]
MREASHLAWPFFEPRHRDLAAAVDAWATQHLAWPQPGAATGGGELDAECRALARRLGAAGWLRPAVIGSDGGPADARAICLVRETLARHDPLADFIFAMQGLGTAPIALFGTEAQRSRWLPPVAAGEQLAAFAISEADAGSDVAAMRTTAQSDADGWRLDGEKTWISNAGIAGHYVVFARMAELGERAYGAFIVPADAPGLAVVDRITTLAPHPLGTIRLDGCHVPPEGLVGGPGKGLRVALGTLDLFRPAVGAAALGMARRALDEAITWSQGRRVFGQALAELQLTRARLADMATAVDAAALMVYRAAWTRDAGAERITREAAMAKLFATEAAQRVIDDAAQLLGARGVAGGSAVEALYREVRALRIYEGTSEVQRLVIATQLLGA